MSQHIEIPTELRELIEEDDLEIIEASQVSQADEDGDGERWKVIEQRTIYSLRQDYDGNDSDPISRESFDTMDEADDALDELTSPDEWINSSSDHFAYIEKVRERRQAEYEYFEGWTLVQKGKWEYENSEDTGRIKNFGTREGNAEDLLRECHFKNINSDVQGTYLSNDIEVNINGTGTPGQYLNKYSTLYIEDSEGNNLGSIELRLSDHSYNPANNYGKLDEDFISIVIANVDETASRFSGEKNIYFDGSNSYNDVVEGVRDRIQEILDGIDLEKEIRKVGSKMKKGGTIEEDSGIQLCRNCGNVYIEKYTKAQRCPICYHVPIGKNR